MSDSSSPPPRSAAQQDVELTARVFVAHESREQVALVGHRQPVEMEVRAVQDSELELVGPLFYPKHCHLEVEIDDATGARSPRVGGVVRKVQMSGIEPLFTLGVRLAAGTGDLGGLRRVHSGPAEPPSKAKEVAFFGSGVGARWAAALVEQGLVSEEELRRVAATARAQNVPLDEALAKTGVLRSEVIAGCRAMDLGVPYVDPRGYEIHLANSALVPEEIVRRHVVFPLFYNEGVITLGMTDPSDLALIDKVRLRASCQVDPCMSPRSALEKLIERSYREGGGESSFVREPAPEVSRPGSLDESESANEIVRLVHALVGDAARSGASDVHIEPERDHVRVRIRVDGILHETSTHPLTQHAAIVSRIKVQAKLDIAETRRPQDGQFSSSVDGRTVDVRVSTIPTVYGENVVLRLLIADGDTISLEDLGMPAATLGKIRGCLDNPNGMILVTGPTGSGKTSTLYAALRCLNTVRRNIVTVEDPVEKRVPLLRQTQVNPKAGVTFASGLRSILRQDPDVIMVGEIRDQETAEISVQAALTGHLVLSTLHTNSAADAIVRLSEMGIAPFLITSSLRAVVGQRLTRRVCDRCARDDRPDPALIASMGLEGDDSVRYQAGRGCGACMHTGYRGRVGIFELLEITPGLSDALQDRAPRTQIEREARLAMGERMRDDGMRKVREGLTTLEEVARIVGPLGGSSSSGRD